MAWRGSRQGCGVHGCRAEMEGHGALLGSVWGLRPREASPSPLPASAGPVCLSVHLSCASGHRLSRTGLEPTGPAPPAAGYVAWAPVRHWPLTHPSQPGLQGAAWTGGEFSSGLHVSVAKCGCFLSPWACRVAQDNWASLHPVSWVRLSGRPGHLCVDHGWGQGLVVKHRATGSVSVPLWALRAAGPTQGRQHALGCAVEGPGG